MSGVADFFNAHKRRAHDERFAAAERKRAEATRKRTSNKKKKPVDVVAEAVLTKWMPELKTHIKTEAASGTSATAKVKPRIPQLKWEIDDDEAKELADRLRAPKRKAEERLKKRLSEKDKPKKEDKEKEEPPVQSVFDPRFRSPAINFTTLRERYARFEGLTDKKPKWAGTQLMVPPLVSPEQARKALDHPLLEIYVTQVEEMCGELWVFGCLSNGATIALEMREVRPFFYMTCPATTTQNDCLSFKYYLNGLKGLWPQWMKRACSQVAPVFGIKLEHRHDKTGYHDPDEKQALMRIEFENKKIFDEYRRILMTLRSAGGVTHYLFKDGPKEYDLHHETTSLVQIFDTMHEWALFRWLRVNKSQIEFRNADSARTKARIEGSCVHRVLQPAPDLEMAPSAPILIAFFDGEMLSRAACEHQLRVGNPDLPWPEDEDPDIDDEPATMARRSADRKQDNVEEVQRKKGAGGKKENNNKENRENGSEGKRENGSEGKKENNNKENRENGSEGKRENGSEGKRENIGERKGEKGDMGGKGKEPEKKKLSSHVIVNGRREPRTLDSFPNEHNAGDAVFLISTQFQILGDRKPFLKVVHSAFGPVNYRAGDFGSTVVYEFGEGREAKMLEHWAQMMERMEVEWYVGYNSKKFDHPYLWTRMSRCEKSDALQMWSRFRLFPEEAESNPRRYKACQSRMKAKPGSIPARNAKLGSGSVPARKAAAPSLEQKRDTERPLIITPGIVQFDAMVQVKQMYKMEKYSLEEVGREVLKLKKTKKDIKGNLISPYAVKSARHRRLLMEYVEKDVDMTREVTVKAMLTSNVIEIGSKAHTSVTLQMERGQQIKIYNMLLQYVHRRQGFLNETARIRAQKLYGVVVNDQKSYMKKFGEEEDEFRRDKKDVSRKKKYVGATVLDPIMGLYKGVVCTYDFSSLYPSIMIAHQLCFSTWIEHKMNPQTGELSFPSLKPGTGFVLWDPDEPQPTRKMVGDRLLIMVAHDEGTDKREPITCCFVVNRGSVLPQMLQELLAMREKIRKVEMKKVVPGSMTYEVLDARQAAIKVICNSSYGFTGATLGYFGFIAIAITTCLIGRLKIMQTKRWVEAGRPFLEFLDGETDAELILRDRTRFRLVESDEKFKKSLVPTQSDTGTDGKFKNAVVAYGDTDSVFPNFPRFDPDRDDLEELTEYCQRDCDELSARLPPPMSLTFEKAMRPFSILDQKKNYWALYVAPPEKKGKYLFKGVGSVRRDVAPFARTCIENTLKAVLAHPEDPERLCEPLRDAISKIVDENVPLSLLNKTVGKKLEYKSDHIFQRTLFDQIEKRAKAVVQKDTRVSYVHVLPPGRNRRKEDKNFQLVEETGYVEDHRGEILVDRAHYLEALRKPMLTYLGVAPAFRNDKKNRRKWIEEPIDAAIKLIHRQTAHIPDIRTLLA